MKKLLFIALFLLILVGCKSKKDPYYWYYNATYHSEYQQKPDEEREILAPKWLKKGRNFKPFRFMLSNIDYLEVFCSEQGTPSINITTGVVNSGSGNTYFEIRREGKFFYNIYGNKFKTLEKALENEIKEIILRRKFFGKIEGKNDKEKSAKVWERFVKSGNLQEFIRLCKEKIIDEEFLTAPFNDIYG